MSSYSKRYYLKFHFSLINISKFSIIEETLIIKSIRSISRTLSHSVLIDSKLFAYGSAATENFRIFRDTNLLKAFLYYRLQYIFLMISPSNMFKHSWMDSIAYCFSNHIILLFDCGISNIFHSLYEREN